MRSFVIENTDRFMIEVFGGGISVLVTDKREGVSAHMQGEDADDFLKSLEDIGVAYQAPSSVWHKATWNDCLAQISDEIILAQNPDYAEWRDAATALGWKVVEKDPSPERCHDGPCLFHEGQDRAMPIGFWREAVTDLGYDTAQEAIREASSGDPAP